MKTVLILTFVCAAHCAAILGDLPANARLDIEHDSRGRLTEIDIDYNKPSPALRTAAAASAHPTIELEHDNQGRLTEVDFNYNEHNNYRAQAMVEHQVVQDSASPLTKSSPVSSPLVVHSPLFKTLVPEIPTPVDTVDEFSVHVTHDNSHIFKAVVPENTAPVAAVDTTSSAIVMQGPQDVLRHVPGPKAPQVIIKGPEVVYKLPAAPSAPAILTSATPTVMVEMYNAPAPVPSPIIRKFYIIEDGELEEVFQGYMQTVNGVQVLNMVPEVDNLIPTTYNVPATSIEQRFHYEDNESTEMFDDDDMETLKNHHIIYNSRELNNLIPTIYNNPDLHNLTPIIHNNQYLKMMAIATFNNPDLDNLTPIIYNSPAIVVLY